MNIRGNVVVALGVALAMTAAAVNPSLACSDRLEGQPSNLHPGGDLGYYIWQDQDGYHLRTTGPGERHLFEARLESGGEFRDVQLVRAEGEDAALVEAGGHLLRVRLETFDHLDGVDFKLVDGHRLLVSLVRDGAPSPTDEIFLGQNSEHPLHNPLLALCDDRLNGQPTDLHPGGESGFYIWRDGGRFYLLVTGPLREPHLYTARLETGGEFQNARLVRQERGDGFNLGPEGHVLELRFENGGAIDGIDFDVANGHRLLFVLQRDGELISTGRIYLGANGEHPETNPFIDVWDQAN